MLSSANLGSVRPALEMRGAESKELPSALIKTMKDFRVIHSVDFSAAQTPAYESDAVYSRLFGKGHDNVYQPTDEELVQIDRKASSGKAARVALSFHFVKMYKDAARLKTYKQTGKFPKITGSTGLSSLREVLSEDASFPATKHELVENQGWKLFDLTDTKRVHASEFLDKLPERTYRSISAAIDEIARIGELRK